MYTSSEMEDDRRETNLGPSSETSQSENATAALPKRRFIGRKAAEARAEGQNGDVTSNGVHSIALKGW